MCVKPVICSSPAVPLLGAMLIHINRGPVKRALWTTKPDLGDLWRIHHLHNGLCSLAKLVCTAGLSILHWRRS